VHLSVSGSDSYAAVFVAVTGCLVCLFISHCVTFACTQMAEDVVKRLLSPGSPQSPRHNSKDNRLNQDVKYMGMGLKKLSAA